MIIGWMLAAGLAAAAPGPAPTLAPTLATDFDLRCATINSTDVLRLQIVGGQGRIRYPVTRNLGAVGKTPKYGWLPLTRLSVEADQITARFRLGWLETPRLRVDRQSGEIEVTGSDGVRFSGLCEPYDAAAPERRF